MILFILDLAGTAVFALTGALKAIKYELDWLGILVLAAITGVGGGVLRDVILGQTPPISFQNELYLIVSLTMGVIVIVVIPLFRNRSWELIRITILVLDALGLGVFTLIGASRGMEADLGPVGIMFTGAVTSCGGGMIRDLLVREIPALLIRDFYATASILGSLLFILLTPLTLPAWITMALTVLFTLSLRLMAMKIHLNLPRPKITDKSQ